MSELPEILRNCFKDLDFLGAVGDNQKICFNRRYYVDKDTWVGSIYRSFDGERMDSNGVLRLTSIAKIAKENFTFYNKNENYGDLLLDKIINARKGLSRLQRTYDSLGKTAISNDINTSAIIILDSIIPHDRKIIEGFLVPKNLSNDNNKTVKASSNFEELSSTPTSI